MARRVTPVPIESRVKSVLTWFDSLTSVCLLSSWWWWWWWLWAFVIMCESAHSLKKNQFKDKNFEVFWTTIKQTLLHILYFFWFRFVFLLFLLLFKFRLKSLLIWWYFVICFFLLRFLYNDCRRVVWSSIDNCWCDAAIATRQYIWMQRAVLV